MQFPRVPRCVACLYSFTPSKHPFVREPGSLGYEEIDMKTFASWGVDAVGIDYCGGPPNVQAAYQKFATAIIKSGRNMQLGMWNLGKFILGDVDIIGSNCKMPALVLTTALTRSLSKTRTCSPTPVKLKAAISP